MNKPNFPDELIAGSISIKALSSICGESVSNQVQELANGCEKYCIPNVEELSSGEVILSNSKSSRFKHPIEVAQKAMGFNDRCAYWTHSMVYVGSLHVAESQTHKEQNDDGEVQKISGTQITSLIHKYHGADLLRCRMKQIDYDLEIGQRIARQALLECHVNKRPYDTKRIKEIAKKMARDFIEDESHAASIPQLSKSIICSEFVLERYAVAAAAMIDEFEDVRSGSKYYVPANFVSDKRFKCTPMTYLILE